MNYFQLIPQELVNLISIYLSHSDVLLLEEEELNIFINYEYLLSTGFPVFYKIIKTLKENNIVYRDYSYRKAYNIICNYEYILNYIARMNYIVNAGKVNITSFNKIRSNNYLDFLSSLDIVSDDRVIGVSYRDNLFEIIDSYKLLDEININKKYLRSFPIFPYSDSYFSKLSDQFNENEPLREYIS